MSLFTQVRSDPLLLKYDALVVDEVHERHLPADVLLGVLKVVLDKRNGPRSGLKPLKVVLMSATLNAELFSRYFQLAPVLTVPGRMYPVAVEHVVAATPHEQAERRLRLAAADAAASSGGASGGAEPTSAAAAARARRRIKVAFDPLPYVRLLQVRQSLNFTIHAPTRVPSYHVH